jgi:hypothetical protein
MINRYRGREVLLNDTELYSRFFRERRIKFIKQYETPKISAPSAADLSNLLLIDHVWSIGDKYYKLAAKYYGDPKDWWVIALFNNKPTEADLQIGDIITIPTPLIEAINYFSI